MCVAEIRNKNREQQNGHRKKSPMEKTCHDVEKIDTKNGSLVECGGYLDPNPDRAVQNRRAFRGSLSLRLAEKYPTSRRGRPPQREGGGEAEAGAEGGVGSEGRRKMWRGCGVTETSRGTPLGQGGMAVGRMRRSPQ